MSVFFIDDTLERALPVEGCSGWEAWSPDRKLGAQDVLVVNANSVVSDSRNRSACGGLNLLDSILADPDQDPGSIAVYSFEAQEALLQRRERCASVGLLHPEGFVPFRRLPFPLNELKRLADAAPCVRAHPVKWWLWRLEASARQIEVASSGYRHQHKNLVAAVRIYLGALQSGNAPISRAESVLGDLSALEAGLQGSAPPVIDPARIVAALRRHHQIAERAAAVVGDWEPVAQDESAWKRRLAALRACGLGDGSGQSSWPRRKPKYTSLMIDDQCEEAGWKRVLDEIAGQNKVSYAATWQDAVAALSAPEQSFDVLLLDCDLGEGKPSGLELLHPLREWSADLPIVMMTAHDNAELALWALRAGCNDFYAKQLADPGDRNSLSYYLRFARAVRRKETETLLRELWRKFEERLPLPQDRQEDELCVRQAFYSLFSLMDGYTWWARSGIVGTEDALSADTWLCRAALLAIGAAPTMELTKDSQEKVSAARHLDWGQRGAKSDEEEVDRLWNNAIRVVKDAVGKLGNAPNDAPLQCEFVERAGPSECRLTREQFDAGTSPGAGGGSGVRLGHLQRSRRGAVQLALGHLAGCEGVDIGQVTGLFRDATDDPHTCLELIEGANGETRAGNHIDPGGKVVLIDDEKDANGWERALGLVYGKQLKCYASLGKFLSACHGKEVHKVADVVLLDLWLLDEATQRPSPEAGLHALEELKRLDPGLPVIVLSGATDAVNALKCMRRGALDYVPKWLDGEEEPEKWKRFAEGLTRKVTATAKLGKHRLRGLWRSMLALEAPTTTPNATAQLLEAVPGWRQRYSEVPGEQSESGPLIMAAIRREFSDLLRPALVLYQSYVVGGLVNGEVPPLDSWRVTRVLASRDNMPKTSAVLAGRAVEFLGWAWCCVEKGYVLTKQQWKDEKDCPGWRSYIAKASSCAAEVWHKRVSAQHAMSAQKSVADPKSVLGKAFRAWDEFEETLAKRATPCQNTRMLHSPPPMADAGSGAS